MIFHTDALFAGHLHHLRNIIAPAKKPLHGEHPFDPLRSDVLIIVLK
jgi:hypothetical protein